MFAFEIFNCYANLTFKPESKCTVENVSACIDDLVARDNGEALEVYKHLDRLLQVDNLCVAVQVTYAYTYTNPHVYTYIVCKL